MLPALLDTDMVSEVIKLRDITVRQRAIRYSRSQGSLTFSAFTRYEILRGYKHRDAFTQLTRFDIFCQTCIVLPVTDRIWERASDLWSIARKNGFPNEDADLVIAASALEHRHTLVTGNTSHYSWIPDLLLDDWRRTE